MRYAEVSDLNARLETPLTAKEQKRAETLLSDASALISAYVGPDVGEGMEERLRIVCCNVVLRSLAASGSDMLGVTQSTVSADIYSQTYTFSNPTGDMFLTKADKKLLGVADGYIGSIRAGIGREHD